MDQNFVTFNDSNLYFQNTQFLQSTIWFVSIVDIDTYVKYSFTSTIGELIVFWWDIKTFNKDHIENENFVVYQIQSTNNLPLIQSQDMIRIDLSDEWFISKSFIKNLLQWFPFFTLILIWVLTTILPAKIAIVFQYISLIWIFAVLLYYISKIIKVFYKTITSKAIDYNWVSVYYRNRADLLNINPEYIEELKKLSNQFAIKEIVFIQWVCLIKQVPYQVRLSGFLKNIFSSKKDKNNKELIQNTIKFFLTNTQALPYTQNILWKTNS